MADESAGYYLALDSFDAPDRVLASVDEVADLWGRMSPPQVDAEEMGGGNDGNSDDPAGTNLPYGPET